MKIGDHVVLSEEGPGWRHEVVGRITQLSEYDITIGEGFSLDLDHDVLITPVAEIEAPKKPVDRAAQDRQYGRRMAAKAARANLTVAFIGEENRRRGVEISKLRGRVAELEKANHLKAGQLIARSERPVPEIPTSHYERVAAPFAGRPLASLTAEELDLVLVLQGYRNMQVRIDHLERRLKLLVQDARGLLSTFKKDLRL